MVEMHFQKNLGLATDDDLLVAADAITCLENERWVIASMEKSGCGPKDAQYIRSALKFTRNPYLLAYITMKRLPDDARWSWDLYGDFIQEDSKQHDFFASNYAEHGVDVSKWPDDLRKQHEELGKGGAKVVDEYKPLYGEFFLPNYKQYDEYQLKRDG